MNISVRPRTKAVAALLAASAVTAASIVPLPAQHELAAVSTVEVRSASVVTDALNSLGTVVAAGTSAAVISADMIVSLPFTALFAAASGLQSPEQVSSLLSYATQLYLNPSYAVLAYAFTYPSDFRYYVLESLALALPEPLATSAYDALNQVADAVAGLFVGLPDWAAGELLVYQNQFETLVGRTLTTAQYGITAPVLALANLIDYLGYLPANVEATVESAIQQSGDIPGLLSNLVYDAADTLDSAVYNLLTPLTYLPAPIGASAPYTQLDGLANNLISGFSTNLFDFLGRVLPPPVTPTPFPSNLVTLNVAPSNLAVPQTASSKVVNSDDEDEAGNSDGLPAARAALAATGDQKVAEADEQKEPTTIVQKQEPAESPLASPPAAGAPAPESGSPSDEPQGNVDSVVKLKPPKAKIKSTHLKDRLEGLAGKSRTEKADSSRPQRTKADDGGSPNADGGQMSRRPAAHRPAVAKRLTERTSRA